MSRGTTRPGGKQTATVNFGGSYDEPLAAGQHFVTVQPGQIYRFAAKRSDVAIVLK